MATRTVIVDDINGKEAEATVVFAYKGTEYEIDLDSSNLIEFDCQIQDWIQHARTVKPAKKQAAKPRDAPRARPQAVDITRMKIGEGSSSSVRKRVNDAAREWLRNAGYDVADGGRFTEVMRNEYNNHIDAVL